LVLGITESRASTITSFGDGSNSFDSTSGLLWLDVTFTYNRSYIDVSSQLGPSGEFAGYRFATPEEVSNLFTDAGITNPYPSYSVDPLTGVPNSNAPAIAALLNLMNPGFDQILGYTAAELIPSDPEFIIVAQLLLTGSTQIAQSPASFLGGDGLIHTDYRDSDVAGDWGSFLVRDVPGPVVGAGFCEPEPSRVVATATEGSLTRATFSGREGGPSVRPSAFLSPFQLGS
jgi:hypothetical protein